MEVTRSDGATTITPNLAVFLAGPLHHDAIFIAVSSYPITMQISIAMQESISVVVLEGNASHALGFMFQLDFIFLERMARLFALNTANKCSLEAPSPRSSNTGFSAILFYS